ncbi:MAG: hypothetical protein HZA91_12025 [Verrucomicrobia bacterium]|nr:hypothetical protein [Verrucomicrobiota bacterium]
MTKQTEPTPHGKSVVGVCLSTGFLGILCVTQCGLIVFGCRESPERTQTPSPPAISVSPADIQRVVAKIVEEHKKGQCFLFPDVKFDKQGLVRGVYLVGPYANETNLAVTCAIPTLDHFYIWDTRSLTESSFDYLKNARQLRVLTLANACPSITPGIVRPISTLQNLRRLAIAFYRYEPGAFQLLSRMPHLEVVHLGGIIFDPSPPIIGSPIESKEEIEKLKSGAGTLIQLDDRDFAALLECKQLREIHVCDMRLSERAIRAAAESRLLRRLDLSGNGFSQEAVEWLRSHSQIEVVTHAEGDNWLGTPGFWAEP